MYLGYQVLGSVTKQMTYFPTSSAKSIYLGALGYVICMLPITKEGNQGSREDSDGTVTGIKISYDQYQFLNTLIAEHCDCIVSRGIKPFPN